MAHYYGRDDDMNLFRAAMAPRVGARRFDEYYRCYPVAMLAGDREAANYGGKIFLPASALEKLTRLHISYPMLFELINGAKDKQTHAGVLEFTAEEGRMYLPYWLMNTLLLEAGDMIQVKSTDLPPGTFIKLQPQSPEFLEISDPKAVLENAFRNFSCLTVGDIFSFAYNDSVYEIEVLEVKPENDKHAIYTMETDLEVDFATPVGYQEPTKATAGSRTNTAAGGAIHAQGTMAQAINYSSIAPGSAAAAQTNFSGGGERLGARRGSKNPTPKPGTPIAGATANGSAAPPIRRGTGPAPLRLPPNKLFFGFEVKPPPKKKPETADSGEVEKPRFQGMGKTLRGKVVEPPGGAPAAADDAEEDTKESKNFGGDGQKLGRSTRQ